MISYDGTTVSADTELVEKSNFSSSDIWKLKVRDRITSAVECL